MSRRTQDNSPTSSSNSLRDITEYDPPQILSVGPPPVPDKDKPYSARDEENLYWDPYAGPFVPNEQNEAGDSIPWSGYLRIGIPAAALRGFT
ncbi:hypothetical protein FRC07_000640 [Ceratobasidium sp. 392]|nr:hypothetical protein FRC07_000640 [Ceratobasidium sp. 392]